MAKAGEAPAAKAAPVVAEALAEAALFEGTGEDGFTVDLSNEDENASGFPVLPRGIYPAVIDDLSFELSQSSSNPMWTIVFEVEGGDFAGQKLFFHLPFTPKMKSRIKRFLVRVAPELANTPFDPKEVADGGSMLGKRARVRVDIRKYEGEDRNNVRDVLPPGEEGGEAADFLKT